jgi:hypothetical protein
MWLLKTFCLAVINVEEFGVAILGRHRQSSDFLLSHVKVSLERAKTLSVLMLRLGLKADNKSTVLSTRTREAAVHGKSRVAGEHGSECDGRIIPR